VDTTFPEEDNVSKFQGRKLQHFKRIQNARIHYTVSYSRGFVVWEKGRKQKCIF